MDLNNKINITESKILRVPIRTIVKDIVEILKLKKVGTFNLPSDSFYSFQNSMSDFSIELYLKKKKNYRYQLLPVITFMKRTLLKLLYFIILKQLKKIYTL